ncbi:MULTISPECIES: hypothetical protein [Methylomonas]|uniref:Uncharacterized protein n=1 Tax=Methylomonas koyamae TaxID=702114 RepID=A0A177N5K4_9GAMM|nr:hypothetical protein [Methylomonas koyamae]OAI12753.1 hypothetical protein A1355_14020 [Methylomonas koyamae]
MTQAEAVWTFLTDLKHRRETAKRLEELARSNPEAVVTFIEALPANWSCQDDSETDLIKRLYAIALQSIADR